MGEAVRWVGTGTGNAEKESPPQTTKWGRTGTRAGGLRLSEARRPNNELQPRRWTAWLPISQWNPMKKPVFRFREDNQILHLHTEHMRDIGPRVLSTWVVFVTGWSGKGFLWPDATLTEDWGLCFRWFWPRSLQVPPHTHALDSVLFVTSYFLR